MLWLALGLCAADLALDWLFRMDRPQRLVMLVLMLAGIGWLVYRRLVRPLSATMSDDALALQVEAGNKQLGQGLISALQLARMEGHRGPRHVADARSANRARAEREAAAGGRFRRRAGRPASFAERLAAGARPLALVGLRRRRRGHARQSCNIWFNRNILLGDRTWPQKTYLVIERVNENGTVVFPRGEDWTQVVSVTRGQQGRARARSISISAAPRRPRPLAMKKTGERQFEATFANVIEPFEFRARGGDAVTDWVRVELVEQPAVDRPEARRHAAQYTGG